MRIYIALIHKDADSDFGVSFPDLPGCVSAGSSIDEAREMAQEALGLHLHGMAEDGEIAPAPSSLEAIMAIRAHRDAVAMLVPAPSTASASVRISVTFPEDVLAQVDAHAEARGFTRSGFLQAAAKRALRDDRSDPEAA